MSVAKDLSALQKLCKTSAQCALDQLLNLGPKPDDDPAGALLWEQHATRLQAQLNSSTATASKLAAASILAGLQNQQDALAKVGQIARNAEKKIKQISEISDLLTTVSRVLDLGLAVLTAATLPSVASVAAVLKAGTALSDSVEDAN